MKNEINSRELTDKEIEDVIDSMTDDQRTYMNFIIRQVSLDTEFSRWFKAFKKLSPKQKAVFNLKVNEALYGSKKNS